MSGGKPIHGTCLLALPLPLPFGKTAAFNSTDQVHRNKADIEIYRLQYLLHIKCIHILGGYPQSYSLKTALIQYPVFAPNTASTTIELIVTP
jgi:hypothetical protein